MSDINISTHGGLVEATIKQKNETYYLVTEDNLNSLKSKSLLCDLFVFLASIAWGAYFSAMITINSLPKPKDDSDPVNKVLLPIKSMESLFLIGGILFTILAGIFFYQSFQTVKNIKKSAINPK